MNTIYKNLLVILFVFSFVRGMSVQKKFFLKNSKFAQKLDNAIKRTEGREIVESLLRQEYKLLAIDSDINQVGQKLKNLERFVATVTRWNGHIDLSHKQISCIEDIKKLIKDDSMYEKARSIDLSCNDLEVINISELRTMFPYLYSINLNHNKIRKVIGSPKLSSRNIVLKNLLNPVLRRLDLSYNKIDTFDPDCIPLCNLQLNLLNNKLTIKQQYNIMNHSPEHLQKLATYWEKWLIPTIFEIGIVRFMKAAFYIINNESSSAEYRNSISYDRSPVDVITKVILDNPSASDMVLNELKIHQRNLLLSDIQ